MRRSELSSDTCENQHMTDLVNIPPLHCNNTLLVHMVVSVATEGKIVLNSFFSIVLRTATLQQGPIRTPRRYATINAISLSTTKKEGRGKHGFDGSADPRSSRRSSSASTEDARLHGHCRACTWYCTATCTTSSSSSKSNT